MKNRLKNSTLIIFGILTLSLIHPSLSAQFNEDSKLINFGTGFVVSGNLRHPNSFSTFENNNWLPIHLSYEFGINENSFAEEYSKNITFGAFGIHHLQMHSYHSIQHDNTIYRSWNIFNLGILGNFHFTEYIPKNFMELDQEKWDIYGGIKVGIFLEYYRSNFDNDPTDLTALTGGFFEDDLSYSPNLSLALGARYTIAKPLAAYAEIGIGSYNLFNIGLTYSK